MKMGLLEITIFLILCSNLPGSEGTAVENELIRTLLDPSNYNKNVIPQSTLDGPLIFKVGVSLIKILDLDTKAQTMKSKLWVKMLWTDERLKYDNQKLNGNSSKLLIPLDNLWKPRIRLANSQKTNIKTPPIKAIVYSSGDVFCIEPMILLSTCTIDVTYFPYDQQVCVLKFFVDGYNGHEVMMDLYNNKNFLDLADYFKSDGLNIIEVPAYLNVYTTGNSKEVDITYYVTIRRKTGAFTWGIVAPTIFSSLLSIFSFVLPIESREKMICGLGSVISLAFILIHVGSLIPTFTYAVPLFVIEYNVYILITSTLSLVATAVVLHLSSNSTKMPEVVRKVFLEKLAKLVLIPENGKNVQNPSVADQSSELNVNSPAATEDSQYRNSTARLSVAATEAEGFILNSLKTLKLEKEAKASWKKLSTVLDRILFPLSLFVTILITIVYFISTDNVVREAVDEDKIINLYGGRL